MSDSPFFSHSVAGNAIPPVPDGDAEAQGWRVQVELPGGMAVSGWRAQCPGCGRTVEAVTAGPRPNVRCPCGKRVWIVGVERGDQRP